MGTSFLAPAAKQIGGTISSPTDSGQIANPDLNSESGFGSDMGLDYEPREGLAIGLRAFYNRVEDAIVDNVVSVTHSQTQSINAGETTAKGIELDLKGRSSESQEWFSNLTYTDTEVTSSRTEITFVPELVVNAGFTSKLPWDITVSPYYQWVGPYYDSTSRSSRKAFGKYSVVNLNLQKLLRRNRNYSTNILLELNNIGDRNYKMPWDFIDPGFNGYLSIQMTY